MNSGEVGWAQMAIIVFFVLLQLEISSLWIATMY